jgi:hypothetical protein
MTTARSAAGASFQITLDCIDPHSLSRFWAAVLGYEIEQNDEQITQLLAQGLVTEDDVVTVDGHLAFAGAVALNDPAGVRPRLLLQVVAEPKTVKNRMHLDVRASTGGGDGDGDGGRALVQRCIEMGATKLHDGRQGPHTWVTLADPEGNEFCVS